MYLPHKDMNLLSALSKLDEGKGWTEIKTVFEEELKTFN